MKVGDKFATTEKHCAHEGVWEVIKISKDGSELSYDCHLYQGEEFNDRRQHWMSTAKLNSMIGDGSIVWLKPDTIPREDTYTNTCTECGKMDPRVEPSLNYVCVKCKSPSISIHPADTL